MAMAGAIEYYSKNAEQLALRYEQLSPALIHACWANRMPAAKSLILDVGAGSGRDAAWFAGMGHDVVAVEPAVGLRMKAAQLHPNLAIRWIEDTLPDLQQLVRLNMVFDVVLVSAVWMHIHPAERGRALKTLAGRLKAEGILIFVLRHGPDREQRFMFPVSAEELRMQAATLPLESIVELKSDDLYGRSGVMWETVVLRRSV